MRICIKHLLFTSLLLICRNMAAQSLFVSSVMDEETISQAVLYSEGLYDLLPTYIETEEEKLKTDLVHKYSKKSAQMDILPKCIEEGLDSKTQVGGYGEYIHTNKHIAIEFANRHMRLNISEKLLFNHLSMRYHNDKTFIDVADLQMLLIKICELSNILTNDIQVTCMHIDSIDNYYIASCGGKLKRDNDDISLELQRLHSDDTSFQEYYCTHPEFKDWIKKAIGDYKKSFYLYSYYSPLVKEENEQAVTSFMEKIQKALEENLQ